MKSNIFFYSLAALFLSLVLFACNQRHQERQVELLVDSTTFYNNPTSDTAGMLENTSADSRMTMVPKSSPSVKQKTQKPAYTPTNSKSSQSGTPTSGNQKEGWSKAAQGAVIGGASGAVGGAIISKNKGAGAAIGAAVGAAGGYIIGREKDKKDGRVKKNSKDKKQ